jgi:hypothetical protein
LALQEFRVSERIKRLPAESRLRQLAIASIHVKPYRPKFVVRRLAQLHFGHPIKNFAGIQIAKDASLKLQKKWRMN